MARSSTGSFAASEFAGKHLGGLQNLFRGLAPSHVSFRTRRLEPLVASALAVATVWIALVDGRDPTTIWLGALAALAIAGWSRSYPATNAWLMLARSVLLLCIAFVLHMDAPGPGAPGAYFFWLPVIACAYALLLGPALAATVLALCVLEFLTAWWLMGPLPGVRQSIGALGTLLVFGIAALMFGRSISRSERQMESMLVDPHSQLYNKAGLFLHGTELLQDCLRNDRAMTMVLLNCADLGSVRDLLGREAASRMFSEAVRRVARAAPRAGLAARTDRMEFVLVLPGLTNARSKDLVQGALGSPPRITLQSGDRLVEVMMDVTVGSLGRGISSMEELYELLQAKLRHRRQPAVQTHSSLPADAPESILDESGGPLSRLELSPTLPMPLI